MLLIVTSFLPIIQKIHNWGNPIILDEKNMFSRFITFTIASLLNVTLLFLCGFFAVIAWPQIVWMVLTVIGLTAILVVMAMVKLMPNLVSQWQDLIDLRGMTYKIDFSDIFTIVVIMVIYYYGGAFAAF